MLCHVFIVMPSVSKMNVIMQKRCYAECRYAESRYAECPYAECHYAECHYPECRGAYLIFGYSMNRKTKNDIFNKFLSDQRPNFHSKGILLQMPFENLKSFLFVEKHFKLLSSNSNLSIANDRHTDG
jgi:hypothetical protein